MTYRWVILLLLVALTLRLGWGLSRPIGLSADLPDQQEYLSIARNLLAGEGLRFFDERFAQHVYAFRSPGYPVFVALCGASVRGVRVVQALLDTSTVLAIYLFARRWLNPRGVLLAAAMVAFNPFLIFLSALILSETLFAALLAWGVYLLAETRITRRETPIPKPQIPMNDEAGMTKPDFGIRHSFGIPASGFGISILLLALAALVRSSAIPLAAIVTLVFLRHWKPVLLSIVVTLIALLPWAVRNKIVLGHWIWTTTNGGHTAYDGFKPNADGGSDLSGLKTWPALQTMGEVQRDRFLADQARRAMLADPIRSLRLAATKIARTWSPVPLSDSYGSGRNRLIGAAFSLPFVALILVGLARGNLPRKIKLLCLLPAIYFTLVHALTVGSLRYRIPVEPVLAVIAGSVGEGRRMKEGESPRRGH